MMSTLQQRRGLRAYPLWAIILLALGCAIFALTLVHAGNLLSVVLTGDAYGRWIMLAMIGAVATPGIALGLALMAIGEAGRRDGKIRRWALWAKLLFLLGGTLCISISLLIVGAGQFGSVFAEILLFFGWIPISIGALLILVAIVWGRGKLRPNSDA